MSDTESVQLGSGAYGEGMTATVGEAGLDPATIDLCDIARYQREGYPWAEFTWLREHAPVFRHVLTLCDQSIALNANSPPSLMPENQRAVTVLVLV